MSRTYMTGYSGATRTEASLEAWSVWLRFDPEFRRRLKMLMDASIDAGHPCGIGGGWRSSDQQRAGFLDRHLEVASGGCCSFNGKRYQLKPGVAHMAPPFKSYHESTTPDGNCLAVDMIGDLNWMMANCGKFGLIHFANVNGEPWHLQPADIPTSRSSYNPAVHNPLKPWPGTVAPAPPKPTRPVVAVPAPTISLRTPYQNGKNVSELQQVMKFWGWYKSTVDGWAGPKTIEGIKAMQGALKLRIDGVYGPVTAAAYKAFAEGLASLH